MKHLFSFFSMLLFLSFPSLAQSTSEIEAKMDALTQALLAEDAETLKSLTSEDLTYGHSSGSIEDQEAFLKVFRSGNTDYQAWDISNLTVQFHGKNIAMVRHFVDGKIQGNPLHLGVMLVWIKEKGDWKLLARQAYRRQQ